MSSLNAGNRQDTSNIDPRSIANARLVSCLEVHKHGYIISNIEERMIIIKSVWAMVDLRNPINQKRLEFGKLDNRSFWARLFRR